MSPTDPLKLPAASPTTSRDRDRLVAAFRDAHDVGRVLRVNEDGQALVTVDPELVNDESVRSELLFVIACRPTAGDAAAAEASADGLVLMRAAREPAEVALLPEPAGVGVLRFDILAVAGSRNPALSAADAAGAPDCSGFRVVAASDQILDLVVSYLTGAMSRQPGMVRVGRLPSEAEPHVVRARSRPVRVNAEDFVGRTTAVIGRTGSGKSNSLAVIACSVFRYAQERGERVGQLIVDGSGGSEPKPALARLRALGDEYVRVYRFAQEPAGASRDAGVREITADFFDPRQQAAAWQTVVGLLGTPSPDSWTEPGDLESAASISDSHGDEFADAARIFLYAVLLKAGLSPSESWSFAPRLSARARDALADHDSALASLFSGAPETDDGRAALDLKAFASIGDGLAAGAADRLMTAGSWSDCSVLRALAEALQRPADAWSELAARIRKAGHRDGARRDYAQAIYDDLSDGRIVIVEPSVSDLLVRGLVIRRVLSTMFRETAIREQAHRPVPAIQVVIDDADGNVVGQPLGRGPHDWLAWLADRSCHRNIGVAFAARRASAIDERILAATANWFVADEAGIAGLMRASMRSGCAAVPVLLSRVDDEPLRDAETSARAAAGLSAPRRAVAA